MKLAWQAELRTVLGLTYQQINSLTNNWNKYYALSEDAFYTQVNLPCNSTYQNNFGIMYWQWANSFVTADKFSEPSMAMVYPANYAGYNEIGYFKTAYFDANASASNV